MPTLGHLPRPADHIEKVDRQTHDDENGCIFGSNQRLQIRPHIHDLEQKIAQIREADGKGQGSGQPVLTVSEIAGNNLISD